MPLFHTCFVALNEQPTCAEASSEAIVGLSLFDTSQKTSGLIICCRFFSGPLLEGTKGSGRLTVESHSPSRCSLAA